MKRIATTSLLLFILLLASTVYAKTLIFPHLYVGGGWSFGIALETTDEHDDLVTFELYADGKLFDRFQTVILANGERVINGRDFCDEHNCLNKPFTLLVRGCSEWTYGMLIRFYNGIPVGEVPAQVYPYTPDFQVHDLRPIPQSKYYVLAGQSQCDYMNWAHWVKFREVLREMYLRYKDVPEIDPRPCLGDATPYRGDCPGHPSGAHNGGITIDMNYFTTLEHNYTGAVPDGEQRTPIWDGDKLVNFDVERNKLFLALLKDAFPQCYVMMDERIKAVVAPDAIWVSGDSPSKWNHDTHMHLLLRPK